MCRKFPLLWRCHGSKKAVANLKFWEDSGSTLAKFPLQNDKCWFSVGLFASSQANHNTAISSFANLRHFSMKWVLLWLNTPQAFFIVTILHKCKKLHQNCRLRSQHGSDAAGCWDNCCDVLWVFAVDTRFSHALVCLDWLSACRASFSLWLCLVWNSTNHQEFFLGRSDGSGTDFMNHPPWRRCCREFCFVVLAFVVADWPPPSTPPPQKKLRARMASTLIDRPCWKRTLFWGCATEVERA